MGPFSNEKQFQRATAIKRLLANSINLDDEMIGMWKRKLIGLSVNEDEYNKRVREIYNSPDFKPMGIFNYLGGEQDD
jgi:hypothetical protein